jgi:hypothetical protein
MGFDKAVQDHCRGAQYLKKGWSKVFFDAYL